jgi:hypothetical protein
VVEAALTASEADEATLEALESGKWARARRRRRRLPWHAAVLAVGVALLAYGVAEVPVLALVGYLVVLGERLLALPTSTRPTVRTGRFGDLPAKRHCPPAARRRFRRHLKALS